MSDNGGILMDKESSELLTKFMEAKLSFGVFAKNNTCYIVVSKKEYDWILEHWGQAFIDGQNIICNLPLPTL